MKYLIKYILLLESKKLKLKLHKQNNEAFIFSYRIFPLDLHWWSLLFHTCIFAIASNWSHCLSLHAHQTDEILFPKYYFNWFCLLTPSCDFLLLSRQIRIYRFALKTTIIEFVVLQALAKRIAQLNFIIWHRPDNSFVL